MPHIDPTFRFWLGILFSVAAAVAGGGLVLKGAFPESWIPYISAWCGIIGFVGNVTLTALNAQASTTSSRALSAAADPAVDRVVMKSQSEANSIPSTKVVGERSMTDHSDYSAVANALMVDIHNLITSGIPGTGFNGVPSMFAGMVPASLVPAAAGQFAKTAVDALDKHRQKATP